MACLSVCLAGYDGQPVLLAYYVIVLMVLNRIPAIARLTLKAAHGMTAAIHDHNAPDRAKLYVLDRKARCPYR